VFDTIVQLFRVDASGVITPDEDPMNTKEIVFQFNLQAADADGGARVLGVHQRGEGIARIS
jgi:hypothetical protein